MLHTQGLEHFPVERGGEFRLSPKKVNFNQGAGGALSLQQRTGHSFGAVLLYNAIGVFADDAALEAYPSWKGAKPGDLIFEDVSGDGKINSDDRILLDRETGRATCRERAWQDV